MSCYQTLHQEIIDGVLAPGEKLTIAKLKNTLHVGQCPIREALYRLVETGLVEIEPNRGFRVSKICEKEIRELVATLSLLDQINLRESIQHGTDQWEVTVVAALHQMTLLKNCDSKVEFFHWFECNSAFHRALVSGSPNDCLLQIRNQLFNRLDRYTRIIVSENIKSMDVMHHEHKKLAELALKRDADEACRVLHEHYVSPLETVIEAIKVLGHAKS